MLVTLIWCPGLRGADQGHLIVMQLEERILFDTHLEIHNNFLLCGLSINELIATEIKIFKLIFRHGLNLFSGWP